MPPVVSLIIPCFNNAQYLQKAVESILSQTFTDLECIIVDDGSTDNTRHISEYLVRKDARVRYLFQKNKGEPSARNTGIEHATGEWIQFLDADVWIHKDKINRHLTNFRSYGPENYDKVVLYTDYELVWTNES